MKKEKKRAQHIAMHCQSSAMCMRTVRAIRDDSDTTCTRKKRKNIRSKTTKCKRRRDVSADMAMRPRARTYVKPQLASHAFKNAIPITCTYLMSLPLKLAVSTRSLAPNLMLTVMVSNGSADGSNVSKTLRSRWKNGSSCNHSDEERNIGYKPVNKVKTCLRFFTV